MSNNKHPIKLKLSLVQHLEAGEDLSQLAKETAISEAILRKWRGEYRRGDGWAEGEMKRKVKQLEREVYILKKASAYFSEQPQCKKDKFLFIDQNRKEFPVKEQCIALGVGERTYYKHVKRQAAQVPSKRQQETNSLVLLIKAICETKRGKIGARGIRECLRDQNYIA